MAPKQAFPNEQDYWFYLKCEIAAMAMTSILANSWNNITGGEGMTDAQKVAIDADRISDAMIYQLQQADEREGEEM